MTWENDRKLVFHELSRLSTSQEKLLAHLTEASERQTETLNGLKLDIERLKLLDSFLHDFRQNHADKLKEHERLLLRLEGQRWFMVGASAGVALVFPYLFELFKGLLR